jgi:hypothetical protein
LLVDGLFGSGEAVFDLGAECAELVQDGVRAGGRPASSCEGQELCQVGA